MSSVLDSLRRCAERHPEKQLYAFLDVHGQTTESYTYASFLKRTKDIASHIRRVHPLEPGARVLLAYPPGLEMICAFFACVRSGLIPVPVYPPTRQGFQASLYKMEFIARDCGAKTVLTDRSYFWSMKLNRARHKIARFSFRRDLISRLEWIVTNDAEEHVSGDVPDAHTDILFLQYTSGSTSDPKGVVVTHENLLHNCEAVVDHVPVGVSWLPQYHDMGLIGYYLFFALSGGTTYGFSPLDFIQRPSLWLETISRYGGTASSAPNFAYEYCLRPDKIPAETLEGLDLSSLRFLMTAAEPVRANVYREFLQRFEPYGLNPESFFAAYGLAEFTLAVTNYGRQVRAFDVDGLTGHEARTAPEEAGDTKTTSLVSCGRPLGTTKIKIVDTHGKHTEVADGRVGEVWLSGPSKCQGYWQRPELTREVFDAELVADGTTTRGWLRTGDLGFVHEGELFLCGRTKDLIIVRGLNYYPQDIEVVVEEDPAIRRGCVAAFAWDQEGSEQLVVVAELKDPKRMPDTDRLNQSIAQRLGIGAQRFVFISARTIPKTSSGKLVRHQALSRWLEGTLEVIEEVQVQAPRAGGWGEAPTMVKPDELAHQKDGGAGDGIVALFSAYGLTGLEDGTLGETGLDSIRIAEFTSDLKLHLQARGNDDLSGEIDLRMIMLIAVSELYELLGQLEAATPHAKRRFQRAFKRLQREHRSHEEVLIAKDTQLRFDVSKLRKLASPHDPSRGGILLTGGTGFFGPFLLKSLLEQCSEDIHVLVRAEDADHGMRRLLEGLASTGGISDATRADWCRRIQPICGDLSQPNLGLDEREWSTLAHDVHTIYHNGALVNYLFDYSAMRDANVGGTHEIVRLALSDRAKVLNLVSTTFVFGWSIKETLFETDTNPDMDLLDFGYSQSKWASEQVVLKAMERGLDARIFRPALISPSVQGDGSNFDISIRLLAFMLKHRMGTTAGNQVSFSPADRAAENIVAIANLPESLGTTCHVTRDTFATMEDVTNVLGRLTNQTFDNFSLEDFVPEVVARCGKDDLLFPLLNFLVRSIDNITAMEFKRYDNSNYQRFRAQAAAGRSDPSLDDVVEGILRFMKNQGIAES